MARVNRSPLNLLPFGRRGGRPPAVAEYDITFDPIDIGDPVMPPEMDDEYDRVYETMQRNPAAVIPTLQEWVYRYPTVPSIKNWLTMCYRALRRDAEADVVGARMLVEHPDYMFGRLYRAERLLDKGRHEEVPDALGGLSLKQMYPQRDLFHFTEALNLWAVLAKFHMADGDTASVAMTVRNMRLLAPDHPLTNQIESVFGTLADSAADVDDGDARSSPRIRAFRQGSHMPKKDRNRKEKRRR